MTERFYVYYRATTLSVWGLVRTKAYDTYKEAEKLVINGIPEYEYKIEKVFYTPRS